MNIPLVSDLTRTSLRAMEVLKADEGISFRGFFIIDDTGFLLQMTEDDHLSAAL